jgi:predicted transcriptional regulator of viral defense system
MQQSIAYESGLTRVPKLEQAMAWLVEHGPVVVDPPLPQWLLHDLVDGKRIARPRRGIYLVPTPTGDMLSLPAVATLLAPKGYLSFYGALVLHGLTDQDTAQWGVVTDKRQGSLRRGQQRLDFVPWPRRLSGAEVRTVQQGTAQIRIATPAQALCDALEAPRYVTSWPELIHVLRTGLATRKVSVASLRARALAINSPALARRLGLLLEMATGHVDRELLTIALRSNDWTRLAGLGTRTRARDPRWRVELPRSREDLLAAVRE